MGGMKNGMKGCNISEKTSNDGICESFNERLKIIFVTLGKMVECVLN